MSGRFRRDIDGLGARHVAAIFQLKVSEVDLEERLCLFDPRTFGEVFLSMERGSGVPVELAHLGMDLLEDQRPLDFCRDRKVALFRSRSPMKARLLDQRFLCGLGNIYSDEVLFRSKIHPRREACSLEEAERRILLGNAVDVVAEAVHYRGSSLFDQSYRDLSGKIGGYQRFHQVYGRSGEPCVRCAVTLEKETVIGRSSTFCPSCQGKS
jgi:formamidopyrimidine-DNA glycosylase